MGNGPSVFLAKRVRWEEYANQDWRSDIAKELDGLGGLDRPPIPRGSSFTQKLRLLQVVLNKHGTELEQFFKPAPLDAGRLGPKERAARRAKIPVPTLLALKQGPLVVAEWRERVHQSRRRTILVVKCVVRLMRGKVRVAPVPRLDRFDFAIYVTLGGEWIRVAEEQQRYMTLRNQVEATTVALQDEIHTATAPPQRPTPPSSGLPPLSISRPGGRPAGLSADASWARSTGPSGSADHESTSPRCGPKGPGPMAPAGQSPSKSSPKAATGGGVVVHTVASCQGTGSDSGTPFVAAVYQRPSSSSFPSGSLGRQPQPAGPGPRDHGVSGCRSNVGSQAALQVGRPRGPAGHGPTDYSQGIADDGPIILTPVVGPRDDNIRAGNHPAAADVVGSSRGSDDSSTLITSAAFASTSATTSASSAIAPTFASNWALDTGAASTAVGTGIEAAERGDASPRAEPPLHTMAVPLGAPAECTEVDGSSSGGPLAAELGAGVAPPAPPTPPPANLLRPPERRASGLFIRARVRKAPPPLDLPDGDAAGAMPTTTITTTLFPGSKSHSAAFPGGSPNSGPSPSPNTAANHSASSGTGTGASVSVTLAASPLGRAGCGTYGGLSRGVSPTPLTEGAPAGAAPAAAPKPSRWDGSPSVRTKPQTETSARPKPAWSPPTANGMTSPRVRPPWEPLSATCGSSVLPRIAASSPQDVGDHVAADACQQPHDTVTERILRRHGTAAQGLEGCAVPGGPGTATAPAPPARYTPSPTSAAPAANECNTVVVRSPLSVPGGATPLLGFPRAKDSGWRRGCVRRMSSDGVSASETGGGLAAAAQPGDDGGRFGDAAMTSTPRRGQQGKKCQRASLDGEVVLVRHTEDTWPPPKGDCRAGRVMGRRLAISLPLSPSSATAASSTAAVSISATKTTAFPPFRPFPASGGSGSMAGAAADAGLSPSSPASPCPRLPPGPSNSCVSRALSALHQTGSLLGKERLGAGAATMTIAVAAAPAAASGCTGGVILSEAAVQRIEELRAQCKAKLDELQRCSQLISVFLNRCNAAWAEAQPWGPPAMVTQLQLSAFSRSETAMVFRNELVRMLRCGAVAVHLRAADDFLEPGLPKSCGPDGGGDGLVQGTATVRPGSPSSRGPSAPWAGAADGGAASHTTNAPSASGCGAGGGSGGSFPTAIGSSLPGLMYRSTAPDLWTQDPWRMLETHRPGMVAGASSRLEGVSLGCRYVASLVLSIEGLAGREAVARLPLVLLVNEDQQDEVVRQLWSFRFFGIPRENVVFIVQPSHPGYSYDSANRTWDKGDPSHSLPLGSGYGLMQLTWRGEALQVNEEGCLAPMPLSALTWMEAQGVQWMISRRARDLSLLLRDGVLDLQALSYGLYYHTDRCPGTNIIMEAVASTSLLLSRVLDSVILSRRTDSGSTSTAAAATAEPSPSAPFASRRASVDGLSDVSIRTATATAGSGGDSELPMVPPPSPPPPYQVVEMCHADLASPAMRVVLANYQSMGRVLTGLGRYMMHLPSISQMLAGRLSVLRPKLGLVDDLLHIRLELADLTSASNASPLLVQARPETPQLLVHDDVEALLPLLQAQDSNSCFRQLVLSSRLDDSRPAGTAAGGGVSGGAASPNGDPSGLGRDPAAQHIVVFVVANNVSVAAVSMAAAVARPGRDVVTLATVVSDAVLFRDRAEALLAKHAAALEQTCGVQYRCQVVERGSYGLIDCMENYAVQHGATLVVLGSNSLTCSAATSSSSCSSSTDVFSFSSAGFSPTPSSSPSSAHPYATSSTAAAISAASLIRIVGSVTLALMRRLPMPLLLVTKASAAAAAAAAAVASTAEKEGRRRPLRALAALEGNAAGMVDYLAGKLCNSRAGDRLFLSYVRHSSNLTWQQHSNIKALLGRYVHQVSGHGMRPSHTLVLNGPPDRALAAAVSCNSIDLLAVPAGPRTRQVPPAVIATLRAANTAVLWYRDCR